MNRFSSLVPSLEVSLWMLASFIGFVLLMLAAPSLLNVPVATVASATLPVRTPSPTRTPAAATPGAAVPLLVRSPLVPVPTPPANAKEMVFAADARRTGWITTGESKPHLGDRNLHAGSYRGQAYKSLLYFDLAALPPGSRILFAEVELTGLNRGNLGPAGNWTLGLLPFDSQTDWSGRSYADLSNAQTLGTVGVSLAPQDLGEGQLNQFVLAPDQLARLESALRETGFIAFRLDGPSTGESLFTWDGGDRDPAVGWHPTLRVVSIPGEYVWITQTPTPQNALTAVAAMGTGTARSERYGTETPLARRYATLGPMVPITLTPTPANAETATAVAAYVTAVAMTTGTFTPMPLNVATVTPTPTATATPPFASLAQFTPMPTPTPRERSLLDFRTLPIPPETGLIGQIAFRTNRDGSQSQVWVMDATGKPVGKLLGEEYHTIAEVHDLYSPDWNYHLDVGNDMDELGRSSTHWKIVVYDIAKQAFSNLIQEVKGKGIGAYNPAWSPDGKRVAFVSERTRYSEIYVLELATMEVTRLTDGSDVDPALGYPPFFKHPSWSPDGSQIVFFSDRGTKPPRKQIWIMNADGSDMRVLSPSPFEDWDPVWIKR